MRLAEQLSLAGNALQFAVDADKTDLNGEIAGNKLLRMYAGGSEPIHWSLQQLQRTAAARSLAGQMPDTHDLFVSCQPEMIDAYASVHPNRPNVFVCGGTTLLHDAAQSDDQSRFPAWSRAAFTIDRFLRRRAESHGFRAASAVVFDSQHTRELVVTTYGLDPARTLTVYGGVDTEDFHPPIPEQRFGARTALGIKSDARVLVWTGRLASEKNIELLLKAVASLPLDDFLCVLVGDGPLRSQLESQVRALAIVPQIRFAGHQSDVRRFLHAADIFVFPSRGESFGCALAEAMACGLACIAQKPDGGKIRNASSELIADGCNGLLLHGSNPEILASAIKGLLADDTRRADMGREARRTASRFDWRIAGERLNRICRETVARSNARHATTDRETKLQSLGAGT